MSNKIVATVIAAVLMLQLFAGIAGAQTAIAGPDLIVEDVDVGNPRVAGLQSRVNITVRNQGNTGFVTTTGWQIFVGLNGASNADCIEPGDSNVGGTPVTFASPCYIRMTPGAQTSPDGTNATNIPAGEARRYTLMWNASTENVNDSATIFVVIGNLGSTPSENAGATSQNCSGPDAPNCANNVFTRFGVKIGVLGVRAVPIRVNSSSANSNVNTAWKRDEVTDPCPITPDAVSKGCTVPAGKTLVARYLITNTGNVDDTYTATFPDDMTYYGRHGYIFAFGPQAFTLGKSQQREVRLTIVIPENETAGNATNIDFATQRVKWTSTRAIHIATDTPGNPGCSDPQNAPFCVNPTLPSFIVDYRRGLNATSNETWRQATLGNPAYMNITLNNTGNADDIYNISFVPETMTVNSSWIPRVSGTGVVAVGINGDLAVAKGELKNVTLQVTPPLNTTNGSYTFEVTMKSRGDTDGIARCKANEISNISICKLKFTVHVGQEWRISGSGDVPARVVPGEPVKYNLGIRNEGNGYENVTLELQSTVFGWNAVLSERVVHLTPFNTTTFTLTVTSPPNIPENTVGAFFVNATASGPQDIPFETRSKASIESLVTILRGPNMRLDLPVNSSFVDAGATASYALQISNVGNVADNFTIPPPTRPSDWAVDVVPDHIELQPNQQGEVIVTLRAPSGATVGEKATVGIKVISSVEPSREKSISLEGRVSGPDFFVDNILLNSTSPYTGDPVELNVVVGNSGNKGTEKNITLRVYFVQNGVERVIGEKLYEPFAIPGQRRLVESFVWDTAGIEGAGVLLARIDVGDIVREIDDSASSNEKTKAITLRTFSIKLTPAEGLSARPGEKVTYGESPNVFIVRYDGNQPSEPVTIRFESEHGWLSSQSELSLALPRGTPIPVIASLDIPTIPGVARDTLTITVVPALRPEETLRASAQTTILDEENPKITRITATPANAKLGDIITFVAELEDATGITSATAYIVLPTNETQSLVLTKFADGRWNGTKSFTVSGTYRVTAEAADAADPPNLNRTRLTATTFTLTPGSAPTIKLAADQATTIRTGSPIKLDVRDPLGIGKVTYSIRGVSYDVKGPGHQIDTSSFGTGPVDILVSAENIYGVVTTQKFSFTVDNTAPKDVTIKMTPEKPKANEQVTLAIKTESKVTAVDVLIKRDGQIVQSINATRKGIGNFEAKFDTPEGDYRIDVTARDSAGNTKLAESAVVFSAKPGSALPGPGLWMLLSGILGLALMLRRRRA